jgi:tetratricopeptide (TPR) repeat protein
MGARIRDVLTLLMLTGIPLAGAQEQGAPPQPPPAPTQPSRGTPAGQKTLYERYTEPIDLFKSGLGRFTRPISSSNKEAQAFSDQGFQMMYAFAKPEAVRSFREAWKRDPECAICYWGEAWAWGSYLNGPMNADEAPHAYAAIQKAISLKDKATSKERALIDAMAVRYIEKFDAARRVDQDKAYAEAIGKVSAAYPDDLEIATLHADALFLLEPRRGTRDIKSESVQRLHRVLERILARDVRHPGACHLYVHATESTVVPERATACAEFLGRSIPGASHINHMPSHTWNEVGRWGDSVRANLEAWHSDLKAAIGEGFAIYPSHNLHMLLYAASMDGQGAIAMQAGKDYAKLTGDTFYQVLTMIRFGRFDEVLEVKNRPGHDILGGFWDFAQGYAQLRTGNADFAKVYLERVKKAADSSKAVFRDHTAKNLLGTVAGILEGEIHWTAGDLNAAIASFERGVSLEDQLGYDEPEPLPFAARHWLGAALLEARRYGDAEKVYREELADHPHNGWSLFGLQKALAGRGVTAREVDEDLARSWSRADTWIRGSRF